MKKYTAVLLVVLSSCLPPPPPPPAPPPEPDPGCKGACSKRERMKDQCSFDKSVSEQECVLRCEDAEQARPGVTGASCVAKALTCDGIKLCSSPSRRR